MSKDEFPLFGIGFIFIDTYIRNGSTKLQKYKTGTFIILYFTLQLLFSVFKHNCGIKKFEKIMVNKYKCREYTT